ncbi:beta-lactamase-like protein [Xylariomycetidae sp. FL0641]|nr:beta-lactamase-like protein [Xylariomycetidae sp. FL0641]
MFSVEIPPSSACVNVSVIQTGWAYGLPCAHWFNPQFKGLEHFDLCSYAFLITHEQEGRKRRVLFDLGIRKDWETLVPRVLRKFEEHNAKVEVVKDVADQLVENGVDLSQIEAVIWSHFHWDHTGDPTRFPSSTQLIVGPGIKDAYMPGWPANLSAEFKEGDVAGRKVVELTKTDFNILVGGFRAHDYFRDGSFYLLDAPGHAVGHMNALARTTSAPDSFVFLAADSVHMGGEFRPSSHMKLPDSLLNGASAQPDSPSLLALHPKQSKEEPFLTLSSNFAVDLGDAEETIKYLQEFDADPRVLVIFAHDTTLAGLLPYLPSSLNGWATTKVKDESRWVFLSQLRKAAGDQGS